MSAETIWIYGVMVELRHEMLLFLVQCHREVCSSGRPDANTLRDKIQRSMVTAGLNTLRM